ncbi:MAG: hypothetical protein NZ928_08050 [Endomicrobia bacterium]|nr:hypothetical protein [Endomicrobiia bacterium]MDW8056612.1 hypothetical protein [Elusimicrobiota bacterium]
MKKNKKETKVKCNKCGNEVDIKEANIHRISTCCSIYEIVLCKKCSDSQKQKDNINCLSC